MAKEQKTLTPMMRQYQQIKAQYKDSILFFRLGDFYEMFYSDAETAADELELVLTSRGEVPMCGIPYHAADNYLARLVNKGYKVAICEQMEEPHQGKGIVRREVIRVVTPGTIIDEKALPARGNNYLAAIISNDSNWGLAWADVSTGEFLCKLCQDIEELTDEIVRLMPAELLLSPALVADNSLMRQIRLYSQGTITNWESASDYTNAEQQLKEHFGFEASFATIPKPAFLAAAMLLSYLLATQRNSLGHLQKPAVAAVTSMVLDPATRRNLEMVVAGREQKHEGSLIWVLDKTVTAMGARSLRRWLEQPLLDMKEITYRQQTVAEFKDNFILRRSLLQVLKTVRDLERLSARIAYGTAGGRELQALGTSLAVIPKIISLLQEAQGECIDDLKEQLDPLDEIVKLLGQALVDNPPAGIREGGIIRCGYNEKVDELRQAANHGREWIANLEKEEKERTGIKSLKVGYNRVFGYYIEITRPNLSLVPPEYKRKQTLANAERFITTRLQELERKVLGAEEKLIQLEYELFQSLCSTILTVLPRIQRTARSVGILDALLSLATVAADNNYTCPQLTTDKVINIKQGRHPVVELVSKNEAFVPNDTYLDEQQRLHIITGPNMAGKSTYIRQVALIVLMAQIGSFVPASRAVIGLVDRIFTRVGAADDLFAGQSTFMVEMKEVAYILNQASEKSLIILDEVGRGTSTADGFNIAMAVTEYLHDTVKARTLFATHYHELVDLEKQLPAIKNYCVAVLEKGEDIIFLRTIKPGSTDKSYGLWVARLAGLPVPVLERARKNLEDQQMKENLTVVKEKTKQIIFEEQERQVLQELDSFSLMTSTPLEAMEQILSWQRLLRRGSKGIKRSG